MKYTILQKNYQDIIPIINLRNYLRITHDGDDELLHSMLRAATDIAEQYIGKAISETVIELSIDVPHSRVFDSPIIPISKIISVTSNTGVLIDLRHKVTFTKKSFNVSKTVSKNTAITIKYCAQIDPLPDAIKLGMLLHIAQMYDGQQDVVGIPDGVHNMYKPYKNLRII
jgi:uncharacterized phiE125 gp8 family phage protein